MGGSLARARAPAALFGASAPARVSRPRESASAGPLQGSGLCDVKRGLTQDAHWRAGVLRPAGGRPGGSRLFASAFPKRSTNPCGNIRERAGRGRWPLNVVIYLTAQELADPLLVRSPRMARYDVTVVFRQRAEE